MIRRLERVHARRLELGRVLVLLLVLVLFVWYAYALGEGFGALLDRIRLRWVAEAMKLRR